MSTHRENWSELKHSLGPIVVDVDEKKVQFIDVAVESTVSDEDCPSRKENLKRSKQMPFSGIWQAKTKELQQWPNFTNGHHSKQPTISKIKSLGLDK